MNPENNPSLPIDSNLSALNRTESEQLTIPVIEEHLKVTKRVIETGRVRLVKTVEEQPETVTTRLTQETFVVERVPIDRYVDQIPPPGRKATA